MSDDPEYERIPGVMGETPGQTLARAFDNITGGAAAVGGTLEAVIVVASVAIPPSEDSPNGSSRLVSDWTPGMTYPMTIGLLTWALEAERETAE